MSLYNKKISAYFTINKITRGFFIAFLSAGAIYLDWMGTVNPFINTLLALSAIFFWLISDKKVWVWSGFFIGILWFWWMGVSFVHYQMPWAVPLVIFIAGLIYSVVFYLSITAVYLLEKYLKVNNLIGKALLLLIFSYIHPLGFDWFKPELLFTNSYLGVEKWQFGLILLGISLAIYKRNLLFLFILLGAYPFLKHFENNREINEKITLHNSYISVEDKWDIRYKSQHIDEVMRAIYQAIDDKQEIIVFPESIFALYLNREEKLLTILKNYSHKITIVVGGLYWDNPIPRNSTYIFQKGEYTIANKVVLVPFGEQNPLPAWLGKWVNKIFFDGAPDYVAAKNFTDYTVKGTTYRNAICFEATSEKLYEGDPKNMIVLSNNGWLMPSIEPTQQKILLEFYSKKYGTTIYHSVNMSPAYIVHNGKIVEKGVKK